MKDSLASEVECMLGGQLNVDDNQCALNNSSCWQLPKLSFYYHRKVLCAQSHPIPIHHSATSIRRRTILYLYLYITLIKLIITNIIIIIIYVHSTILHVVGNYPNYSFGNLSTAFSTKLPLDKHVLKTLFSSFSFHFLLPV